MTPSQLHDALANRRAKGRAGSFIAGTSRLSAGLGVKSMYDRTDENHEQEWNKAMDAQEYDNLMDEIAYHKAAIVPKLSHGQQAANEKQLSVDVDLMARGKKMHFVYPPDAQGDDS